MRRRCLLLLLLLLPASPACTKSSPFAFVPRLAPAHLTFPLRAMWRVPFFSDPSVCGDQKKYRHGKGASGHIERFKGARTGGDG